MKFFAKLYTIEIGYQVRKASVRALSDLITSRDVVDNILLAKKYRVKPWLRDGYLKLIKQTEPPKIDRLSLNLDLLTIARICFIRDMLQVNCCCGICLFDTPPDANTEIIRIFADEMKETEDF